MNKQRRSTGVPSNGGEGVIPVKSKGERDLLAFGSVPCTAAPQGKPTTLPGTPKGGGRSKYHENE